VLKRLASHRFRLPRLGTYVPTAQDPRIFWFNSERQDIVEEVVSRIMGRHTQADETTYVLNDVAHHEVQRLELEGGDDTSGRLAEWRSLVRKLGRMSDDARSHQLRQTCERMAHDVAGNFDPRVYQFAARTVPGVLTAVMNPSSLVQKVMSPQVNRLDDIIVTEGSVERVARLSKVGTVVLVPTHSSNLDSLAVAWALHREGLPPVVYGAGKNLFTNPIVSFFMHNLGAYRVDRRINAALYKDILKAYSSIMIERGYNSLFFPGGKRIRSGEIDSHLKLGLAGTAVEAFARNAVRGNPRPVFFVPTTINYGLVLEAETLIDDHLKEQGQARYIIDDDEFSRVERWVAFFHRARGLDAACVIRFGDPVDPFCNPVDDEGHSISPAGNIVDPVTYVSRNGIPSVDPARDKAYTEALGEVLAASFRRETVVMETQLVAHVLFRRLVRATPGLDLFSRLRHRGDVAVPRDELVAEIGGARNALVGLERAGKVHVKASVRDDHPSDILTRALAVWNGYHTRLVAREYEGAVLAEDPSLLLFYGNRLRSFAVEIAAPADLAAAREIANMEWTG
jgi:glycerol-3-phosphate O-acyltransferase